MFLKRKIISISNETIAQVLDKSRSMLDRNESYSVSRKIKDSEGQLQAIGSSKNCVIKDGENYITVQLVLSYLENNEFEIESTSNGLFINPKISETNFS